MVQPPSKQLRKLLLEKKLCTARDLRRCISRVRRLSADLPAFDSVWLDALVANRSLTSFQAQAIENGHFEQLRVGPCVVLDRIGHSASAETFLTRLPEGALPTVVKRISCPAELKAGTLERLIELIENARRVTHPSIALPHACRELPAQDKTPAKARHRGVGFAESNLPNHHSTIDLAVVSKLIEGMPLSQLLLRRGRFPARAVQEIAKQLLDGLAAVHAAGIVHGEILLSNVLLDRKGRAILIDTGIRPAVNPEFSIDAFADPERYDGIAPELIGTGEPCTHLSDLYAVGCLLWYLLAGRPAHPTGDPLARLAAHQTDRIPDIQEIAPETSSQLGRLIQKLTEPNPAARPQEARVALDLLSGRSKHNGRRRTSSTNRQKKNRADFTSPAEKSESRDREPFATNTRTKDSGSRRVLGRFARSFQHMPSGSGSRKSNRLRGFAIHIAAAAAAVVIAIGAIAVLDGRTGAFIQAAIDSTNNNAKPDALNETLSDDEGDIRKTIVNDFLDTIPEPNPSGTIELAAGSKYEARSILWAGRELQIRAPASEPATIVVDNEALRIRSSSIVLENVRVVTSIANPQPAADQASRSSIASRFESQTLKLINCEFAPESEGELSHSVERSAPNGFAVVWSPVNPRSTLAGDIQLDRCLFAGSQSSIGLVGNNHRILCRDTLKIGGGPMFVVNQTPIPGQHTIQFERSTLRNCEGLLTVRLEDGDRWNSRILIQPIDSVIHLRHGESESTSALLIFEGRSLTSSWSRNVVINGRRSVAPPELIPVGTLPPGGRNITARDGADLNLSGLSAVAFRFRGDPSLQRETSIIEELSGNLGSTELPGIRLGGNDKDAASIEPMPIRVRRKSGE